MRKKIVAGNWKMNMDLDEGLNLAKSVNDYFRNKPAEKCEVILCTPFIHLAGVSEILKSGKLKAGAQNCASEASGAYTGEVSALMIKSTGANMLDRTPERRSYYNEDSILNRNPLALEAGPSNILLWRDGYKKRITKSTRCCRKQLRKPLLCKPGRYEIRGNSHEPVWAIGTGLTATRLRHRRCINIFAP